LGAAKAIEAGGAQFVKTSTGFEGGATVEGVNLIRTAVSIAKIV
jgi:deoxyribose-phosphate aldolase